MKYTNIYSSLLRRYLSCLLPLVCLCSSSTLPAQSNWSLLDDFDRPHLWEEVYRIPYNTTTNQLIPSPGDIHIENGQVVFDDCGNMADKRVYRKIGAPLDDSWVLDFDFTPTAGGPSGTGHVIAGVTAGTQNPFNIVPDSVTVNNPSYARTQQDGILIWYISAYQAPPSDYYVQLQVRNGGNYQYSLDTVGMPPGNTTYYFRLARQGGGDFELEIFLSPARTGTPYRVINHTTHWTDVEGLNVIQHSTIPQGSPNRRLTATIDNVRLYDTNLPCVECEEYTLSLSNDQNYISTKTARVAVGSASALNGLTNSSEAWADVAYFDGLGRPLQEVMVDAAPNCQGDLIQYHQYDALGREAVVDLPYVDNGSSAGSFRDDGSGGLPITSQRSFYSTANFPAIPTADLNVPFAETEFEASPLNRALEQGAPGEDWQVGNPVNDLHTIRTHVRPHTDTDDVLNFGIDPSPSNSIVYDDEYPDGELMRQEVIDENGHYTLTYTDKMGRTILVQQQIDGADARTYYLYDQWGRVKYVLQPQGVEEFQSPSSYGGAYLLETSLA